jgi:hypothetical protein
MNNYIEKIDKTSLPVIVKFQLKILCHAVNLKEQLQSEGKELNRKWLDDKLKEHGIE